MELGFARPSGTFRENKAVSRVREHFHSKNGAISKFQVQSVPSKEHMHQLVLPGFGMVCIFSCACMYKMRMITVQIYTVNGSDVDLP
jgi:hypothetical protein